MMIGVDDDLRLSSSTRRAAGLKLIWWFKQRRAKKRARGLGAAPTPNPAPPVRQTTTSPSPPDSYTAPGRTRQPAPASPSRPQTPGLNVRPAADRRAQTRPRQDVWCDRCDLDRRFCVHGLEDRRAMDTVFATRLGSTYHLRQDCNAITVPRARSLALDGGNSRMYSMTRGEARNRGLEPCRICAGATTAHR